MKEFKRIEQLCESCTVLLKTHNLDISDLTEIKQVARQMADYSQLQGETVKKIRADLEEYIKTNEKPVLCKHCFWKENAFNAAIFCKRYGINKRENGFCDMGKVG